MISGRLLITTALAVRLLAGQGRLTPDEAFAAYRHALEDQLSAMLHDEQTPLAPVHESKPLAQNESADGSNAGDIKTFASGFRAGGGVPITAAFDRLQRLRPRLESILDSEGLPRQLVAVVLIESGAQPLATSPRQARGLWQLIPATARRYGLTVTGKTDERVNLEAATRAAARYLRDLYIHFGDWPLALAAYNVGQDAVDGALAKSGSRSLWQLSAAGLLPQETRSYVPAVLRAMRLLDPAQPGLPATGETQSKDRVYASVGLVN